MIPGINALFDLRPLCAWPSCPREPDVQIEYGPAQAGDGLEPPLECQPAPKGGAMNLCRKHAAELRAALDPSRIRKEMSLQQR